MLKSFLQLLLMLAAGYAAYLGLLFTQQRQMMFPGGGMDAPPLATLPLAAPLALVELPASFGRVLGIWIPASVSPAPAAIFLHGNAEFAAQNVDALRPLAALGVSVLVLEYPGYAGSDGRPSRDTLNEAALLAYDWLASHPRVDAARIAAIGRSVGSGPAAELSQARQLAALVLLSPFASLDEFAHQLRAPACLIRDRFDNLARLREYSGPVLLLHGRDDDVIDFQHSERLQAASASSQLIALDCAHNDCPYFDAAFYARLKAFFAAHLH